MKGLFNLSLSGRGDGNPCPGCDGKALTED